MFRNQNGSQAKTEYAARCIPGNFYPNSRLLDLMTERNLVKRLLKLSPWQEEQNLMM